MTKHTGLRTICRQRHSPVALAKVVVVWGIVGVAMHGTAVHAAAFRFEQAAIEISVREGLVTLNARNVTAVEVLQAIARRRGRA